MTKTEWKWYPVHQNWSKSAHFWEFPDLQKISGKIPEKLEFWNSDSTIMLSDLNWVGNIPKMSKFVQTSQFLGISRLSENFWQNSRKIGILQFWLHNHAQWPKLSGIYTQNVKIGLNQPISGNFQISRKFLAKFQKNWNFEILTSQSCSVT